VHPTGATPRHRWVGQALGVAILCSSLGLAGAGSSAAAADPVAEKRAEAEQLARELEEQGRQVSILAERLNQARIEATGVEERVRAAEADLAVAERRLAEVRARLRDRAVSSYVRNDPLPIEQMLVSGSASDAAVRQAYVATVAGRERATITSLDQVQEERRRQRQELDTARSSAAAVLARVDADRGAASRAADARRATLARVQGELTALVEEETRRRAEAEARRAQAELAERRAREEAARAEAARRAEEAARRAEEAARRVASTTAPAVTVPRLAVTTTTRRPGPAAGDGEGGAPARPPAPGAAAAVAEAKKQLGKPYEWGADGPDSFDCSGLTQWAWKAGGRSLPHSSVAQYGATTRVPVSDVQVGDLLFYGSPIHHVGIYAGDGQMVEASETGTPVRMASIYRRDLAGVGRVG